MSCDFQFPRHTTPSNGASSRMIKVFIPRNYNSNSMQSSSISRQTAVGLTHSLTRWNQTLSELPEVLPARPCLVRGRQNILLRVIPQGIRSGDPRDCAVGMCRFQALLDICHVVCWRSVVHLSFKQPQQNSFQDGTISFSSQDLGAQDHVPKS
jgi:hypothetical protein